MPWTAASSVSIRLRAIGTGRQTRPDPRDGRNPESWDAVSGALNRDYRVLRHNQFAALVCQKKSERRSA